jgi:hypothetical protein
MNCCICYEENEDKFIYPKYCLCKMYFHEKCLNKCEEYNIYCPICKTKKKINININIGIDDRIDNFINRLDAPMRIFINHPNFLTFLFVFLYSFIVTIFIILPIMIHILYPNIFKNILEKIAILTIFIGLFLLF